MQKITEIVYGNSIYFTMKNSKLKENKIILFNTIFSIGDLRDIDNFKIYVSNDIIEPMQFYDFTNEIFELNNAVENKHKIRVWCSHQDSDSYILLTYICNYLKDRECDLYVIYSDDYNNDCMTPACFKADELEKTIFYERKLNNENILELSNEWDYIKNNAANIRIMKNNKVKLVNYSYFDDIIIRKLKELGAVKQVTLVGHLLSDYHLIDLIFVYLINRLIENNKIIIVEKDLENNDFKNIISVKGTSKKNSVVRKEEKI